MASLYATQLGIGSTHLILAFLLVQFLGIPFTFLFGTLADRIGAKPSIFMTLVVYTVIATLGYFMTTATHFYVLATLVATVQGGSQALSRSLFASMIPRDKSSEFFGFFSVFEKFAGIFGPLLFAASIALLGIEPGGDSVGDCVLRRGRRDSRLRQRRRGPADRASGGGGTGRGSRSRRGVSSAPAI